MRRLDAQLPANSYVGRVDTNGFRLTRYGRTAVRIRGRFTPTAEGCRVDYRVELVPWMVWMLVASYLIGIPVLVGLAYVGYIPVSVLAWAALITVFGLGINAWYSERQARELRDHVVSALGG